MGESSELFLVPFTLGVRSHLWVSRLIVFSSALLSIIGYVFHNDNDEYNLEFEPWLFGFNWELFQSIIEIQPGINVSWAIKEGSGVTYSVDCIYFVGYKWVSEPKACMTMNMLLYVSHGLWMIRSLIWTTIYHHVVSCGYIRSPYSLLADGFMGICVICII